jgi:hypothetical protein
MPFYFLLAAVIFSCCAAMIFPTWCLARAGFRRTALVVAIGITTLVSIDHFNNWDGLSYPLWLLGAPAYFYPFSVTASIIGIAMSLKALADHA